MRCQRCPFGRVPSSTRRTTRTKVFPATTPATARGCKTPRRRRPAVRHRRRLARRLRGRRVDNQVASGIGGHMPTTHYEASPLRRDAERGAVLIHVVVAMIGLLGFSGFVIDYGILWSARRQAQNSADAAAIAAAISLGYVDYQDQGRARAAAIAAATNSAVWGEPPHITDADVTFPACPPGAPPDGLCVRADVYRDQDHNNPLPTFFTQLVGVMDQGVRATATAEVRLRLVATCIKPFAIPDKWDEHRPITKEWEPTDTFERFLKGTLLVPADIYRPLTTWARTIPAPATTRRLRRRGRPRRTTARWSPSNRRMGGNAWSLASTRSSGSEATRARPTSSTTSWGATTPKWVLAPCCQWNPVAAQARRRGRSRNSSTGIWTPSGPPTRTGGARAHSAA